MAKRGRILSGIRPTGPLHLGHYVGILTNWRNLQKDYECFYEIADLHAMMSEYADPSAMAQNTRECLAECIACGLSPDESVLFVQSHMPEHSELHLILSMIVPLGWLERCPTYKEQLREMSERDLTTYAFLGYPVLQAADIMLYKADTVPVGEDQLPHLEITREVARRFNSLYQPVFPEPQAKLSPTPRLLGLDRRKMSKSYKNFIALADGPDAVRQKVMSMITDPQRIRATDPGRPEYCNVHDYYASFAPEQADAVAGKCRKAQIGCVECKRDLAGILVEFLAPIREKRTDILSQPRLLDDIIEKGAEKARAVAKATMEEVRRVVNFAR